MPEIDHHSPVATGHKWEGEAPTAKKAHMTMQEMIAHTDIMAPECIAGPVRTKLSAQTPGIMAHYHK